jgi:hypothetical protein
LSIEVQVRRTELLDYRKKEFIDELLPTLTVKRAVKTRGTGSTVLGGSHYVGAGSSFLMTYLGVYSGSPGVHCGVVAKGSPYPGEVKGTIDYIYFEAKGGEVRLGNPKEPVHAFGPGTFQFYWVTPGSARDYFIAFEGVEL